jgi:hypothetical protein
MKPISTFWIVLFLFAAAPLFAQKRLSDKEKAEQQIYEGFVVRAAHNDTIFGEIQFFNPTLNEEVAVFFDAEGKKTKFYPEQGEISEYSFLYQRYNKYTKKVEPYWFTYVRKAIPNEEKGDVGTKEVFLQREVWGNITLYNHYTLVTEGINERKYKHSYFIEKQGVDGFQMTRITRDIYRESVKTYLVMGNQDLENNLGTVGFGYKYLGNLVEMQNAWLDGDASYYGMLEFNGVAVPASERD